jgi:hypothetical protein
MSVLSNGLIVLLCVASTGCAVVSEPEPDEEGGFDADREAEQSICAALYEPVCAQDKHRYPNACEANEAGTRPRAGGALIEISGGSWSYWFWSRNDAFIDEAIAIADGVIQPRVPVLNGLQRGLLCSDGHTFKVDPANMTFADFTIELCDGSPGYIDRHFDEFVADTGGQWCPWGGVVVRVEDQRSAVSE